MFHKDEIINDKYVILITQISHGNTYQLSCKKIIPLNKIENKVSNWFNW